MKKKITFSHEIGPKQLIYYQKNKKIEYARIEIILPYKKIFFVLILQYYLPLLIGYLNLAF